MTRWVVQVKIKEKGDIDDEVILEKSVSMIHRSKLNMMTLRKKKYWYVSQIQKTELKLENRIWNEKNEDDIGEGCNHIF